MIKKTSYILLITTISTAVSVFVLNILKKRKIIY